MSKSRLFAFSVAVLCAFAVSPAMAHATPTLEQLAAQVSSLQTQVDTLKSTVSAQSAEIATLKSQLSAVKNSNVMKMNPYVSVNGTTYRGLKGPRIAFIGTNIEIRNGAGATNSANGLGNLVIGYDEMRSSTETQRTGSHNLIVGAKHRWTTFGSMIAGYENSAFAQSCLVGGTDNVASGQSSSVTGGKYNTASGPLSSVIGGENNIASGSAGSVCGGTVNVASGWNSTVLGGFTNKASGGESCVSGGSENESSGYASSVSGGNKNDSLSTNCSVSGGQLRSVSGPYDWRAGTLFQDL